MNFGVYLMFDMRRKNTTTHLKKVKGSDQQKRFRVIVNNPIRPKIKKKVRCREYTAAGIDELLTDTLIRHKPSCLHGNALSRIQSTKNHNNNRIKKEVIQDTMDMFKALKPF